MGHFCALDYDHVLTDVVMYLIMRTEVDRMNEWTLFFGLKDCA
jgi:hypothetical protein